ncbi:MAG: 30S ribosomal protein S24e [Nitrososphaerota archaeon]|jgi:small subunit ribosomal protein S24e|nr:30S ribosomal protein S24e [Nitrososphaerota archaeon]
MEIKIVSTKENPLLKRKEVGFTITQDPKEKTPNRLDTKRAVANAVQVKESVVYIKCMETLTGTNITNGVANVYQSVEQAQIVEPNYIKKRNNPEKPKEEAQA